MQQAIKFFCKETEIYETSLLRYCSGEFQFKRLLEELFKKYPNPSNERDKNILILMKCYHKIFIEKQNKKEEEEK